MARKFAWQTIMTLSALFVLVWSLESRAQNVLPSSDVVNCYLPVEGGLRISLRAEPNAAQVKGDSIIGVTKLDPYKRTARRPLYPPADKSLIWSEQELEKIQRSGFRPLVMAYLRPRFMVP